MSGNIEPYKKQEYTWISITELFQLFIFRKTLNKTLDKVNNFKIFQARIIILLISDYYYQLNIMGILLFVPNIITD